MSKTFECASCQEFNEAVVDGLWTTRCNSCGELVLFASRSGVRALTPEEEAEYRYDRAMAVV